LLDNKHGNMNLLIVSHSIPFVKGVDDRTTEADQILGR
jgi:hypothetical protein